MVEEGDVPAARLGFRVRGRGSGAAVEGEEGWAIWMREGKLFRIEQCASFCEAIEAAGLKR